MKVIAIQVARYVEHFQDGKLTARLISDLRTVVVPSDIPSVNFQVTLGIDETVDGVLIQNDDGTAQEISFRNTLGDIS